MAQIINTVASLFIIIIVYYGYHQARYAQRRKGLKLPPGPKGIYEEPDWTRDRSL